MRNLGISNLEFTLRIRAISVVRDLKIDLFLLTAVVILQPLNIILAEIGSPLDFDKNERFVGGVLDAVGRAYRNIDGLTGLQRHVTSVESDLGKTLNDHPVFGPLRMLLITQALVRQDFDTFDLIIETLVEDGKTTPGAFVETGRVGSL